MARREVIHVTEKEKEIMQKIADGLPFLTDFDKGYFLGVVEAKVDMKQGGGAEQRLEQQAALQTA